MATAATTAATAALASNASAAIVADEDVEVLDGPIRIRRDGTVLENRCFVVGPNFEPNRRNCVIEILADDVELRNVTILGTDHLPFRYQPRWNESPGRPDGRPGVNPGLLGIRAKAVSGLKLVGLTVAGFPNMAVYMQDVRNVEVEDFAFHHVQNGLVIRNKRIMNEQISIKRVRGSALWRPLGSGAPLSPERHGGETGEYGLDIRDANSVVIEDVEMLGDHCGNQLVLCSQVAVRRFTGASLAIQSSKGFDRREGTARDILIEDSEFSRLNAYGEAAFGGVQGLHLMGKIEDVRVVGCTFTGGRPLAKADGSGPDLDEAGQPRYRVGHGLRLSRRKSRMDDLPLRVQIEDCLFMGHNGREGESHCAAVCNDACDGTSDQTERFVGGLKGLMDRNAFVEQDVISRTEESEVRAAA